MQRIMYKSKVHGAIVTESNINYTGSITIDERLLEKADMLPNERVQIVNLHNGTRVETYIIKGKYGSGTICMNGAAARWAEKGDKIIIISYCILDDKEAKSFKPKIVFVDEKNKIKRIK